MHGEAQGHLRAPRPGRRHALVGAALVLTGTLTSLGATFAAAAPPAEPLLAARVVPLCTSSYLAVTEGGWDAGAGHVALAIDFRNTGTVSCRMSGYPAVSVLNATGRVLAHAAPTLFGYMGGVTVGSRPPTVVVEPGKKASALVEATASALLQSRYLLVTPPRGTKAVRLYVACGFVSFSDFEVHPVVAGAYAGTGGPGLPSGPRTTSCAPYEGGGKTGAPGGQWG